MTRLLFIIASLHVLLCPFTKVEESFNIQAFHDILHHRHNLSQYDHNEFPGVVPRTFIGPLVISILSAPVVAILSLSGAQKLWIQYIVRLTLALTVVGAWSRLRNTVQKIYGNTFAWWFTIITVTQYHFMFYMSRPLPNIMTMPLVLLAYDGWLIGKYKQFIITAGASIIIFRSELAMLFGLFLLIDMQAKKISIPVLLKIAVPAGIALVSITVLVDSIFWRRLLWPEAEVFIFNTVKNKSSDWGTSPFLWYFYSALPRGLGPSLLLVPVGIYLDKRLVPIVAPAVTYVILYSMLPHKELRFIIYVFPLLNMASAAACSYIYTRRSKAPIYELLFWGTVVVVVGNIVLSVAFTAVAMKNYPGGVAINKFHKLVKDEPFVHVHICNLAAQTGVTRFTQINSHWMYSKNESLSPDQLQQYTHLLVEAKSKYSSCLKVFSQTHHLLDSVDTFSQISINSKLIPPIKIKTRPAIFILERKDFREYPSGNIQYIDTSFASDDSGSAQVSEEDLSNGDIESNIEVTNDKAEQPVVIEAPEPIKLDEDESQNDIPIVSNEIENYVVKPDELEVPTESEEDIEEIADEDIAKPQKPKKIFNEIKLMRQEKKKRAIQKIKSETRKEVVASAKEKLKELMKRHKNIAEELPEIKEDGQNEIKEEDGRGDIPETEYNEPLKIDEENTLDDVINDGAKDELESPDDIAQNSELIKHANENIDEIVEEVIVRLIDRKIYDDKTKPEDIKAEDRQMIQQIVEEILIERMNKTREV